MGVPNLRKADYLMRSFLYALARLLGDARAILRGPEAITKRVVNKAIGRKVVSRLWWR